MKLVASSIPGHVDRFDAIQALTKRAVLTRLVCRELSEQRDGKICRWRSDIAMQILATSMASQIDDVASAPSVDSGAMHVPDDCNDLYDEILDGEKVCEALQMLYSADTPSEFEGDMQRLRDELSRYWEKHPVAVFPPAP